MRPITIYPASTTHVVVGEHHFVHNPHTETPQVAVQETPAEVTPAESPLVVEGPPVETPVETLVETASVLEVSAEQAPEPAVVVEIPVEPETVVSATVAVDEAPVVEAPAQESPDSLTVAAPKATRKKKGADETVVN